MQPYRTILVSCRYSTFYLFLCDTYFVYFGLALHSMLTLQFDIRLRRFCVSLQLKSQPNLGLNISLFSTCTKSTSTASIVFDPFCLIPPPALIFIHIYVTSTIVSLCFAIFVDVNHLESFRTFSFFSYCCLSSF